MANKMTCVIFVCNYVFQVHNREYLAPQIRSMNNRFHSEAKLPWSYEYPLANHFAANKNSANREKPLFLRLCPSFGYLWKIFPPRGLKYSLFSFLKMWLGGSMCSRRQDCSCFVKILKSSFSFTY